MSMRPNDVPRVQTTRASQGRIAKGGAEKPKKASFGARMMTVIKNLFGIKTSAQKAGVGQDVVKRPIGDWSVAQKKDEVSPRVSGSVIEGHRDTNEGEVGSLVNKARAMRNKGMIDELKLRKSDLGQAYGDLVLKNADKLDDIMPMLNEISSEIRTINAQIENLENGTLSADDLRKRRDF